MTMQMLNININNNSVSNNPVNNPQVSGSEFNGPCTYLLAFEKKACISIFLNMNAV